MKFITEPSVELIAWTDFKAPEFVTGKWEPDGLSAAEDLIEFSGRNCYQSWSNPAGRTNADYIGNLLEHGHLSVLEHAAATFLITGVSRSLTHELVRHRHLSPSQESQRYVPANEINFVVPPAIQDEFLLRQRFESACRDALESYTVLLGKLEAKYAHVEDPRERKKAAREAARSVLPNAAETRIVLTGNLRAWRWFVHMRGTPFADKEIRRLAVVLCGALKAQFAAVFADFEIRPLPDGTQEAFHMLPY